LLASPGLAVGCENGGQSAKCIEESEQVLHKVLERYPRWQPFLEKMGLADRSTVAAIYIQFFY
jgi:hypothetical protein